EIAVFVFAAAQAGDAAAGLGGALALVHDRHVRARGVASVRIGLAVAAAHRLRLLRAHVAGRLAHAQLVVGAAGRAVVAVLQEARALLVELAAAGLAAGDILFVALQVVDRADATDRG